MPDFAMVLELVIDLIFLGVALVDLATTLLWDMQALQRCDFMNSRFYEWIQRSEEYLTTKRVIALVIFIASVTTMAVNSPFVVAFLAFVLLLHAISQLKSCRAVRPQFTVRMKWRYFIELALMLCVAVAVYLSQDLYYTGVAIVFFLTFSYAFTLVVNWIVTVIEGYARK